MTGAEYRGAAIGGSRARCTRVPCAPSRAAFRGGRSMASRRTRVGRGESAGAGAAGHRRLVDAVAALGARRVLLVRDGDDGRARVAAARLPPGERAVALLDAVRPWLEEARRTRRARLRHGPEGAPARQQRSCAVVPLPDAGRASGFLYADLDGSDGRWGAAELRSLKALATAAPDPPAQPRPDQRVAGLAARLDARERELAIIDALQRAVASEPDFQRIVDVVGDKLREVFATGDLSIRWWDEAADRMRALYV